MLKVGEPGGFLREEVGYRGGLLLIWVRFGPLLLGADGVVAVEGEDRVVHHLGGDTNVSVGRGWCGAPSP